MYKFGANWFDDIQYSLSNSGIVTIIDPGDFQNLNGSSFNFNFTIGKYF